ncbi:MAG: ATP-binding cassette domain-containing protein [Lachnospiraceae bacterium]
MNKKFKKLFIILAWLGILEIAAMLVHNSILLVGPVEIARALFELLQTEKYYLICLMSLCRIMAGMLLAFLFGCVFGAFMYRFSLFDEIISPVLAVMKSIPVASFVVLLLIWQGARNLSVFISFIVVFPNVCVSMKNGLKSVTTQKRELADVFQMKGFRRWLYIYRPAVIPYLISCMEISIGMSFKSGVAAEVIGMPDYSIGERIYVSKVYLDTAGLFAWTFSLIVLSFCVEKMILHLMKQTLNPISVKRGRGKIDAIKSFVLEEEIPTGGRPEEKVTDLKKEKSGSERHRSLEIKNISKSFDGKPVLMNVTKSLKKGDCYLIMAPSGSGKTTLFRIIAGLEKADAGRVEGYHGVTYQFQEDRLLDTEFTMTNMMLNNHYSLVAEEILPKECLCRPVSELSGGMKRRVSLVRAMLYQLKNQDAVCLLDEPFTGMDEETKDRAIAFIKKYQNGRTLLIATHDEKDCERLGGILWEL